MESYVATYDAPERWSLHPIIAEAVADQSSSSIQICAQTTQMLECGYYLLEGAALMRDGR